MFDFRDLIDRYKDGDLPAARWGVLVGVLGLFGVVAGVVVYSLPKSQSKMAVAIQVSTEFEVRSIAFNDGKEMAPIYTEDGENRSPPLDFLNVPETAVELALICDDPDAGDDPWVHWVIYKIPPEVGGLAENVEPVELPDYPVGAMQGQTSWGEESIGYRGPAPPEGSGRHRYVFTLYALSAPLEEVEPGLTKQELLTLIQPSILAQTKFVGTYKR